MLKLYNTLTRRKEEFTPIKEGEVGLYTCGPTVYDYAHIGNLRTYIFEDILKRALWYNHFKVKHVMNITDVGHLTGDRDMGEDKVEEGARREGKTAGEITKFYTDSFKRDMERLNLLSPDIWCKATDHIKEQITLIVILEKKGYTYKTGDGIYFDTSKFQGYTGLSHQNLEFLKEGARVEKNDEKRNPTDFALWKLSPEGIKRQQEWKSPWGVGFPGWHIECSAMSMKYLGEQFDIHCGGIDHVNVHHTNEIAQSEAATGKKPWVRFWMHGAFLNITGGKKMAKSEENFLTLENAIMKRNIDPLAYRYAVMSVHYRKPMEYSEESVRNAASGLEHLYNQVRSLGRHKGSVYMEFRKKFSEAVNDDLNMPQALAITQETLKSQLTKQDKMATISEFDKILGLDFDKIASGDELPKEVSKLAEAREKARSEKQWEESDRLRGEIENLGYTVEDTERGMRVFKK